MLFLSKLEDTLAVLVARRAAIAAEIAALRSEDEELAAAERSLHRLALLGEIKPPAPAAHARAGKRGRKPLSGDKSQRELVLDVLARHEWMTLSEIVAAIARYHGVAVAKLTLSPLLSALKREHLVVRRGRRVALPRNEPGRRKSA